MSGYFIWNLLNEPSARLINFIWNDHECKIRFIIWLLQYDFIPFEVYKFPMKINIVDTDVVNDVTYSR